MARHTVTVPRKAVLKLARYEHRSLDARARTSPQCSKQWRRAAATAKRVVTTLEQENDAAAIAAAMRVGPAWKAAADCEGWPTGRPPGSLGNPGREAVAGEINYPAVDRFTAAHYAWGVILGAARLPWWGAAIFAVGWEFVERPLKRAMPKAFPHSTQDTIANATGDAIAMMAGYGTWQLMTHFAPLK